MKYWLMKTEPNCYSIDDLKKDKIEMWDGTRNYQVRNMMRDQLKVGDRALFYHSNAGAKTGAVGTMAIKSEAYPDPTQFDPKSEHSDPKSSKENPGWWCVDVGFESKFKKMVTLAELKIDSQFADMPVVKKGNRLSVMPISKKHFDVVVKLGSKII